MKKVLGMSVVVSSLLLAGCATGPKTALNSHVLRANRVVYFEQSDRIPKDVLLASFGKKEPTNAVLGAIPPEVIAKIIEELAKMIPAMAKNYSQERMFNALIGRRMLFIGYESPEQLEKINDIVKSMGKAIEYVTPQNKVGTEALQK